MADERDIKRDVPAIGQHNTQTCWVASYQMAYAWKNPKLSVAKAKAEARAKLDDAGLNTNRDLVPGDFEKAAIAVGLWGIATSDMQDMERLVWCLSRSPVWCAGEFSGGPHAIVVTGIRLPQGRLFVNDPWQIARYGPSSDTTMYYKDWRDIIFKFSHSCQVYYLGR